MSRFLSFLSNLFPLYVLTAGVLAMVQPGWFTWFDNRWIVGGLAVVMMGMGITLDVKDFRIALTMPKAVLLGFFAQFIIMPLAGYSVAWALSLPPALAVGLILVGCCPGGTASNIVAYLARGNVALSVLMTTCSTMAAIILTPLLCQWLAGQYVPVDGWAIFLTTLQVVLAPVLLGLFLHHRFPRLVQWVNPWGPLVSGLVVAMICGSIMARSAASILDYAGVLLVAVILLHSAGFSLGYAVAHILRFDPVVARTVSIEVGMQNSGLGAVLARQHFSAEPLTAVPAALSSVCHSVIGSILAGIWRLRDPRVPQEESPTGMAEAGSSRASGSNNLPG